MTASGIAVLAAPAILAFAYLIVEFSKWIFSLGRETARLQRRQTLDRFQD